MEQIELTLEALIDRARAMTKQGRKILGITGAPGAGKSTIAKAIISALGNDLAAFAPMDGFHVDGYLHLLRRLRAAEDEVVHAPDYYRSFEESIGSAIPIHKEIPLVVTEGNYLLATEGGWGKVSGLLDECWFIDLAEDVRIDRLIKRHIQVGKSQADAEKWSRGSDQKNAEGIIALRDRADVLISLSE